MTEKPRRSCWLEKQHTWHDEWQIALDSLTTEWGPKLDTLEGSWVVTSSAIIWGTILTTLFRALVALLRTSK